MHHPSYFSCPYPTKVSPLVIFKIPPIKSNLKSSNPSVSIGGAGGGGGGGGGGRRVHTML